MKCTSVETGIVRAGLTADGAAQRQIASNNRPITMLVRPMKRICPSESRVARSKADRQREVIIAEAYRDAQKIKGEGDAKSSALYAEAFGRDPQFAQFYRSLEAYRATFRNKGDMMVLDPSSDFFRAMRGGGAAPAPARK
jgi:HflC protein